ncbi:MAG: urea ABC transporter substrate-binding protein [Nitrosopumilaceae archaeon]
MDKQILAIIAVGVVITVLAAYLLNDFSLTKGTISELENYQSYFQTSSLELDRQNPIKIGILHSLSGTMAISEAPLVDVYLATIDMINENGGIMGREVVYVIADGKSDWDTFALEAERLIVEEEVDVVVGGWTSASRKAMKPVFEEHDHLLIYPIQYEGLESSENILYTGAAPNQQILPAADWAQKNLGQKIYLVGSDYVFPRAANEIIKDYIKETGGQIVGEKYRPLGDNNFSTIVEDIKITNPDVILNTINGDSNIAFFKALHDQGVHPGTRIISFSITENEILAFNIEFLKGTYLAWNYFSNIDTTINNEFVHNLEARLPENIILTDPMEAAYLGLVLYSNAVELAGSEDPSLVRQSLKGMTYSAPEGAIGIDPETNHLAKSFRIAEVLENGQIKIVYSSDGYILPQPFPESRSIDEWNEYLLGLYEGWNQNWAAPAEIMENDN